MALTLKQIAWNGIQFSIPATWDLVWIDACHLTFGKHGKPAMEIKWGTIKGRYSHRSQLKKINQGHKAHPNKKIRNWQLPSTWKQALGNYSYQGFCWQTDSTNGHGATLYCPACRKAIIFHIFNIGNQLSDPGVLNFLKTLADHRDDGCVAWNIFDMQALLPKSLGLNHYQFKPGNHQLAFLDKSMTVRLYRWAPASALLADSGLVAFVAETLMIKREQLSQTAIKGYPAVEMRQPGATGWRRRLARWRIKPALKWVLVWHIDKHNRILGISLESKKPFKPDQMIQFSDNFHLNIS